MEVMAWLNMCLNIVNVCAFGSLVAVFCWSGELKKRNYCLLSALFHTSRLIFLGVLLYAPNQEADNMVALLPSSDVELPIDIHTVTHTITHSLSHSHTITQQAHKTVSLSCSLVSRIKLFFRRDVNFPY